MANKKFSDFDLKTSSTDVAFVVGFNGSDNVRIAPSNLSSGGASDLNGLTDCSVTSEFSQFIGNVPSGVTSGNAFYNTCLGHNALESLTGGAYNTVIGFEAGDAITTNNNNTVFGAQALSASNPSKVTAIGQLAGNTASGNQAVYVGYQAGRANTATGHISIGYQAGYSQTSGSDNVNLGSQAGYSNTTGGQRTCIGANAGKNNTGVSNTFIGRSAGSVASANSSNVVIGANCMAFGAIGSQNVAIGMQAAQSATGNYNAIVGMQAGQYMTSGNNNTFLGFEAGRNVTIGGSNVVIGYQAMDANTDGDDNVAIGANALGAATSDGRTVAIGVNALKLQNQTFSPMNTAVGYAADDANVSGFGRTCIGGSSGGGATGDNITNIGYQAVTSTSSVSNEITLGNSSVTSLRCAVTSITSLSDERDKSEVKDLEYGLDLIDALQPREFVWDNRVETDKEGKEFFSSNKGKKDFGFIAQEVQALDNDTLRLVYDENPEKLELSYGKLVPVLVKAIQDLSAKVTALENA